MFHFAGSNEVPTPHLNNFSVQQEKHKQNVSELASKIFPNREVAVTFIVDKFGRQCGKELLQQTGSAKGGNQIIYL